MPPRKRKSSSSSSSGRKPVGKPDPKKLAQASNLAGKIAGASATRKPVARVSAGAGSNTLQGKVASLKAQLKGSHVFVLNIPFEAKYLGKSLGAQYNPKLKIDFYEGLKLPIGLEPYRSEDYSFERWVEDELNVKHAPIAGVKSVMKPRPHQVDAVRKIDQSAKLGWRGFILADAVGIGKTLEAVFGAYVVAKAKGFTATNPAKTLIVAPKSVLPHWRNTIKATGINNLRVVVINYDQAKKLLDAPASASSVKKSVTASRHTMLKGKPNILWDIIVADESHKLKNESQRSAAFNSIARYSSAAQKAPFVMWCSATVAQTPLELGYLAPLVGQITGNPSLTPDTWGDWLIDNGYHVKKSTGGNFSWIKAKKESNPSDIALIAKLQKDDIKKLSSLLFSPSSPSIRRIPEEIQGWPTQDYVATPLSLSADGDRLYKEAWNEFRKYIGLHPRGKNPNGGLAATLRFRQKASMLSALATAEFVNDLLDNGLQVAISVEFMETLDTIKDYLEKKGWHCAEFTGRNNDVRESERLRFQKGQAQVMLFSVLEAINLHSSELLPDGSHATSTKRAMVVHDIRYSSIDMTQIVGRTTRDGQLAIAYLMYTENTIEPQILKVVLERMKNLKTLSGDDEETLVAVQSLLDGI